ncbi:multidrug ABC transporter ATP-binding protein [Kineosporia sp. NBRC 101677]|uniref:ABC transporter ATP-binding protein n=1 Tax=Kineosporia sp. NBRC 101677 TaxID=3032197 RepID=UPI0024A2FA4E|nr:ABC transporter ATP-binding protein [Kineosporia sp. NBRC 101677]GLY17683.1 multidrug ABC transporter ATP-binding protein [Kineosporia sp. NBRC 101677]
MSVSSASPAAVGPVTGPDVLRRMLSARRGQMVVATLLLCSHQFGEVLVPVVIGRVIDEAVAGAGTGALGGLVSWIAGLAVVFAVLSFSYQFGARKIEAVAEWSAHDLRLQLTERVLHARGGAEEGRLPGALTSIATSDAQRAGAVAMAVGVASAQITAMVVAAVALLWVSLPLGLVVLVGAPLMLWLTHLLGRPLESRSEAEQEEAAAASGVAADLVAGLRVLKGIGAEQVAVERYRTPSRRALAATVRAARARGAYEGAILLMTGVFLALVAAVGGKLALDGVISIGELTAAIGLAQFLLGPLQVFAWVGTELAAGRASAGRVAEVLSSPELVGGDGRVGTASAALSLEGVASGCLRHIDLRVEPGELVGVVPRDPADALELLRIIGRETDPHVGHARLGDDRLSDLHPDQVRGQILVAAHDAELFGGPLLENLGGSGELTAEVLAASAADEVIGSLPEGAATVLTERGGNLSGGQRQRVALARALNLDAPILVLHDPTTAVDSVTEARIAAGIRRLRHPAGEGGGVRTTVLVTTSPALLAVTDRVVLLVEGRCAAQGRHADLVRDDEIYRTTVLS